MFLNPGARAPPGGDFDFEGAKILRRSYRGRLNDMEALKKYRVVVYGVVILIGSSHYKFSFHKMRQIQKVFVTLRVKSIAGISDMLLQMHGSYYYYNNNSFTTCVTSFCLRVPLNRKVFINTVLSH